MTKRRFFGYWVPSAATGASIAVLSVWLAFLLRFDFRMPQQEMPALLTALWLGVPLKLVVFCLTLSGHRNLGQYAGMQDVVQLAVGNAAASAGFTLAMAVTVGSVFPRSVYVLDFLLSFVGMCLARFALRLCREGIPLYRAKEGATRVLIYGAGTAGAVLARELQANSHVRCPEGFIDDDPFKRHTTILGLPVLGTGDELSAILAQFHEKGRPIDEVFLCMPSCSSSQVRKAAAACRASRIPCKTVPSLLDLVIGKVNIAQLKDVSVEALLGREPVRLDDEELRLAMRGRAVLVTGAAGSIGSEICRQVSRCRPRVLVTFDQAESDSFRLEDELRREHPELRIEIEIGDIRDRASLDEVMERFGIDTVFHAAAYKHVPLMERQVLEAVINNVIGTWNLVRSAHEHQVRDFVMISSDKAVNPTSVMGATKRVGELMISAMPNRREGAKTKFVAVRFGNVLVSNGSVVPTFQKQIAMGGPVTITHPDIKRYFMMVQEAVGLVLQASLIGAGSEIFVLDMGEPVRIMDLARNMIRLSGLEPGQDIEIRVVGLRPGEKLFEELRLTDEETERTRNEKVRKLQGARTDIGQIEEWVESLRELLDRRDQAGVIEHLKALVPEYQASERPRRAPVRVALRAAAAGSAG